MELIGAGLAALGVIGPGIGIGILTGMTNAAIGRNPDAAGQIRAQFILGAAFAEGLGVLAVVVGLLVIFANPFVGAATPSQEQTIVVDILLSLAAGAADLGVPALAEEGAEARVSRSTCSGSSSAR